MHRLLLAMLLGTVSFAAASVGTYAAIPAMPIVVQGKSKSTVGEGLAHPQDLQAQQAIDEATAAALIGALQSRFPGIDFQLRLGDTRTERVSLRDIALQGEAKLRFADARHWLPLRFEALYDTSEMRVESPHITLGAESSATAPDAGSLPLARLQAELDTAMDAEYQSNRVDVALQHARIVDDDGTRYIVQATGQAVFDGVERLPLTVRAFFDRTSGRWLDPQYALDENGGRLAAR